MDGDLEQRIKSAADVLRAHGAVEVYVFGSAATGKLREHSDVDLAIVGLPPEIFFQAMADAADILGRPVDLVDLADGGPLVDYLKRKGKLQRVA